MKAASSIPTYNSESGTTMPFAQKIDSVFDGLQANQYHIAETTTKERIKKLKALRHAFLHTYNRAIKDAVYKDLRKHEAETELSEVFPVVGAINFAIKNLRRWMRNKPVPTPPSLLGFSHGIYYEPKGVVLIIAPWNFPINLCMMPLVSAIAAGNVVVLKPSEVTPHSSAVVKEIIEDIFETNEVAVVEGAIPETTYLLKKPFNHIFFTGAPSIGKIVMKAAAENLSSVSLELGGKSPTIIDESADIDLAALRLAWAKNLNNGQICIAPDYVLVHESVKQKFVTAYKAKVEKLYGSDVSSSDSYGRIVSDRHYKRLVNYIGDAEEKNGEIILGGNYNEQDKFIEPTMIAGLSDDALLWQEEIFGPILPLRTFSKIEETITHINKGEKPLALYIYSKNRKNINAVIKGTRSGAVGVNYSATHYTNPHLPFGGVNNSGIGKASGHQGFLAFSNAKAIQKNWSSRLDFLKLIYPPYTATSVKLSRLISRYFS